MNMGSSIFRKRRIFVITSVSKSLLPQARYYGTPSVTKINSAIGRHKVRENVMHARRAVIFTRRAVTLQDVL